MQRGVKEMNKKRVVKYCIGLILNIAPFFLTLFLYEGGIAIALMFPALQFLINLYNYNYTEKIPSFLSLNLVMLISSISSLKINNNLYYNNISSDTETLAVGSLEVLVSFLFVLLMTLISVVCRIVKSQKYSESDTTLPI